MEENIASYMRSFGSGDWYRGRAPLLSQNLPFSKYSEDGSSKLLRNVSKQLPIDTLYLG